MKIPRLALGIGILILLGSTPVPAQQDPMRDYRTGQKLLDQWSGQREILDQVEKIFTSMLKASPGSAAAYTGLGRLTYKKGYIRGDDFDPGALAQAQAYFQKALNADPAFFDAHYYGAYAWMFAKDLDRADELARKARQLEPDNPKADLLAAEVALRRKDLDQTEKMARATVTRSKDPKTLKDAHLILTRIYRRQNRLDLAEASFKAIIDLDRKSPWSLTNYAQFLTEYRKDYDRAIRYADRALALMDFGVGRKVLARAYSGKGLQTLKQDGQVEEAEKCFLTALHVDPRAEEAYYGLGFLVFRIGRDKKDLKKISAAKENLNKAIRINPDFQQARSLLEEIERVEKEWSD